MSNILEMPTREANGHTLTHPAYRCKATDLWPTEYKELKPADKEDLDRYLADFCQPVRNIADEVSCVGCGSQLTARTEKTSKRLGKTVDVDERTGEGRCLTCAYPLRALHRIFTRDGRFLVELVGFPLLYHPNSTTRNN